MVKGEQYAGFKQIGSPQPDFKMNRMVAAMWLAAVSVIPKDNILDYADARKEAFRIAARKLHPDNSGSHEEFLKLQEVRRILEAGDVK